MIKISNQVNSIDFKNSKTMQCRISSFFLKNNTWQNLTIKQLYILNYSKQVVLNLIFIFKDITKIPDVQLKTIINEKLLLYVKCEKIQLSVVKKQKTDNFRNF
jgi:hypothetical protein